MEFSMSGWLDKRGGLEATKRWKKRWCILSNHLLRYYKSDTDSNPAGTIFAEDIVDVAPDEYESKKDSKHGFVFKILTRGRDYIFNAPNQQKRDEWISRMRSLLQANREQDAASPEVHYATVEVFPTRGIRITGEVSSVLIAQLTTTTAKTTKDERGWFSDQALPHASILNLFTQHGWSLATAFQSNSIPPNSTSTAPADTLIFTHPFNTPPIS
jgi:hypothetical protein